LMSVANWDISTSGVCLGPEKTLKIKAAMATMMRR
jgi:hypothetical protein